MEFPQEPAYNTGIDTRACEGLLELTIKTEVRTVRRGDRGTYHGMPLSPKYHQLKPALTGVKRLVSRNVVCRTRADSRGGTAKKENLHGNPL